MRDSNEKMIELLDVNNASEVYSALIAHTINGTKFKLRFGIDKTTYVCLKRILQFRPFENTAIGKYRYFFSLSYRLNLYKKDVVYCIIRVEQVKTHKQFELEVTKDFVANLLWFYDLKDTELIQEMITD